MSGETLRVFYGVIPAVENAMKFSASDNPAVVEPGDLLEIDSATYVVLIDNTTMIELI